MDCRPPGSSVLGILQARIWSDTRILSPGYPPTQGSNLTESPTLQVDSLPSEPAGKPYIGLGRLYKICQNPSLSCSKPTGSLYHTQNKYQSPPQGPSVSPESRPLSCLPGSLLPSFSAGMLFLEHTKQAVASQASLTASA